MVINQGNTLFLVATPFQCLCMLEAIKYFKISCYEVIVTFSDNYSLDKVEALLRKNNIPYTIKNTGHTLYGVLPFLFQKRKTYHNFFIGDFYSENNLSIAYILAKFRANIFFLDDGIQALSFFSTYRINKKTKLKVKLVLSIYKLIGALKCIKRPVFFTIYNVNSSEFKIIQNPLALLKARNHQDPKGIYIIGTNSSVLDFKDNTYEKYLVSLIKILKKRFSEDEIFYCPHRRDPNLPYIYSLCSDQHIEIYETKISVEFDFVNDNIYPKYVVGFSSNALYTLNKIYPKTIIENVDFSLQSEVNDKENQIIQKSLSENGINAIRVF